jgi:CBS domain-containing protein
MKIEEIMTTKVIAVGKNDSLTHILELMKKHAITKMPVLDGKEFLGIVSDNTIAHKLGSVRKREVTASRLHASSVIEKGLPYIAPDDEVADILRTVGAPGPTMLPVLNGGKLVGVVTKANLLPLVKSRVPVSSVMQTHIITASPDDRVIHARRLLIDKNIARLPVLGNQKELVGMISDFEIALAFAKIKDVTLGHQNRYLDEVLVRDTMRSPVIWASPNLPASDAAKTMLQHNIGSLPILDHDRMIGMVTRTDLLRTIQL